MRKLTKGEKQMPQILSRNDNDNESERKGAFASRCRAIFFLKAQLLYPTIYDPPDPLPLECEMSHCKVMSILSFSLQEME